MKKLIILFVIFASSAVLANKDAQIEKMVESLVSNPLFGFVKTDNKTKEKIVGTWQINICKKFMAGRVKLNKNCAPSKDEISLFSIKKDGTCTFRATEKCELKIKKNYIIIESSSSSTMLIIFQTKDNGFVVFGREELSVLEKIK